MSLPEDLRQEYLKALGIDSYFPRVKLPAAPEPVPCEWSRSWHGSANDARRVPPTAAPPEPESPPVRKPVATNLVAKPATAGKSRVTTPESAGEEVEKAVAKPFRQEDVRLQLLCIRVNESLAILNTMPHLGPQQLGSRHRTLLQNLLGAAGISHAQIQFDEKPFRWPMVQGEHVDNGRAAAASALSAFVQQKHADWQFSRLLIMGEFTVKQVFTNEGDEDGSRPSLEDQAWQCLYARSLDECLQQPGLKKELWSVFRRCRG